MPNYPIQPEQLPTGFCAADYQTLLNGFAAAMVAVAPDGTGRQWVFSATKPADTTVGWWALDGLGRPGLKFLFAQGAWLSLHPMQPGMTVWWFATVPDFTTFDGGDANPISDVSGAMWQLAKTPDGTVIAAQFPIAAGTLSSGKVLAAGDKGGNETTVLTADQTPVANHVHGIGVALASSAPAYILHGTVPCALLPEHPSFDTDPGVKNEILSGSPLDATNPSGTGSTTPQPVNVLPPYVCGYLLQRSSRRFYAVN